jgi:hypothetical protein
MLFWEGAVDEASEASRYPPVILGRYAEEDTRAALFLREVESINCITARLTYIYPREERFHFTQFFAAKAHFNKTLAKHILPFHEPLRT